MEWNDNIETSAGEAAGKASVSANPEAGTGSESTIDTAKQKARQTAGDAQHKLTDELRARADSTRARAADALGSVAQALSHSGQQLRNDNQTVPGDYVERFGGQIRRASDYLRNTGTDDLVRDAENFARRQPAALIGGALALGFLAARLIKSSQAMDRTPGVFRGTSPSFPSHPRGEVIGRQR